MSKLCKKCGCVLFDQNSDYCDSCKSKEPVCEIINKERYVNFKNKDHEFADNHQWVESALNTMSYLVLIIGIIGSFLFAIIDWGSSYKIFNIDEFNFWSFVLAIFFTTLSFVSWKALVIIVRCCLKYLHS